MQATRALPVSRPARQTIDPQLRIRLVGRLVDSDGCDEPEAEAIVDATVAYLHLCADHPGRRFPPSPAVDRGWHAFLLFTRAYREFCAANGGFIDHEPAVEVEREKTVGPADTVAFMRDNGIAFDEAMWAITGAERADCGPQGPDGSPCTNS